MSEATPSAEPSRDFLIMKALAEAAAEAAAEHLATRMRDEMRSESKRLRHEIVVELQKDISAYHGDMTPTEHLISHSRLDRLLGVFEKVNAGAWTNLGGALVRTLLVLLLVGYFLWNAGITKVLGLDSGQ